MDEAWLDLIDRLTDVMTQAQQDNREGKRDLSAEEIVAEMLAAIDASGTHWVAPSSAPPSLADALVQYETYQDMDDEDVWEVIRDAYLAERRKGEE